jgi:very-short-patch-repair endonuclease
MPLTQKEVMLARAREQRRNNVNAEAMIWRAVRSRRSEGFKFRRQVPIENFILDFVCFESRCVVEIDGPSHEGQAGKDARRDAWLAAQGFRVLRISNDLALGAPDIAVRQVLAFLKNRRGC